MYNLGYLDLINNQSEVTSNIYDTIENIVDTLEKNKHNTKNYFTEIIEQTNENVEIINKRLNQMDLDIIDKNKLQSIKREQLSETLDNTIKENNKKNGIYKTEITKRLTRIKKETDVDIKDTNGLLNGLLKKVEINKKNEDKEMLLRIKVLEEKLIIQCDIFDNYKKNMEKVIISLKKELRITRNMTKKKDVVKGLTIK